MTHPTPPKTQVLGVPTPLGQQRQRPAFLRRFLAQPATLLSLAWLLIVVLCAVFASALAPYDPLENQFTPDALLQGPSAEHWLGTDDNGRDVLSRMIFGARIALLVGLGSVLIAILIGVPIGLLLGYRGGWWDRIGTRFVDILDALPGLLVAVAVIAILGRGLPALMLAIGLIFAMNFARMTRAITLTERGKMYIDAAKVSGLREVSILFQQILPNLIGPLVIQGAVLTGSAIIIESMLSFLGIGLQSAVPSWGGLLGLAAAKLAVQPFLAIPPGIAIVLTVLSFNMIGDGINDALAGEKRKLVRPVKRVAGARTADSATISDVVSSPVLEVRDLEVALNTPEGTRSLVRDVNLTVRRGEIVGLIGESGSGKSTLARAILGLMQPGIGVARGAILLDGEDIAGLGEKDLRGIRGARMAAIFQDPMASLSPVHSVGQQLCETLRTHAKLTKPEARARAAELLTRVGVANAAQRLDDYPHQFSGGMAQRVAIAIAIASNPELIIADEATSALDVTTQAQVLDLLLELRDEMGLSILFITHGLGVAAEACDRVVVMYQGEVVETAGVWELFDRPQHEYTARLLAANPALHMSERATAQAMLVRDGNVSGGPRADDGAGDAVPLLRVRDLALAYRTPSLLGGASKPVVEGVSFDIAPGETLGLVGESGSGKSTTGRAILRLLPVAGGTIEFQGTDITSFGAHTPLSYRKHVQAVFQDPSMSLNPQQPVAAALTAALARHGIGDRAEREHLAEVAFAQVGLTTDHLARRPAELSGGQQQRVAIARALVLRPQLVVCDEAVSALDLLTQRQIIDLLAQLQEETGISYLFIAHDLGLVRNICDRIAVMRLGKLVELAGTERLFNAPEHPYTKRLLGATPADHPEGREERRRIRTDYALAHASGQIPTP
ncbi:peptide/nickel transport system ATP-binding protein/peptide/nickel transport system permease protein [Leucobacter luti]|uniref:Peptide/nickel transport system ATP-binding protein/peptide/nickel transport system permease protein n=1 Tax=Leucobacter luti TaxID=340320 RepID=A0A4R6S2X3_9MICO|nr:dipeptide ABC transporter ATP-binding protein [Leucobacter luti]TDP93407.1 peptide/nickel transport system ATP-binding protein/peptide/nickel transport system permease protein [Leucobacter luti]